MFERTASDESAQTQTHAEEAQPSGVDTYQMSTAEAPVEPNGDWASQYADPVIDPEATANPAVDETLLYYQADCAGEPTAEDVNNASDSTLEPVSSSDAEPSADAAETTSANSPHGTVEMASVVEAEQTPVVDSPAITEKPTASTKPPAPAEPVPTQPVAAEPVSSEPVSTEPLFRDLDLRDEVKRAVAEAGYDKPTPIQAEIIPYMLDGRDVLAQSQTGTGKTAAFALPILSRIDMGRRKPQVLVLAPTRELAVQVARSFTKYGAELEGFETAAIYGGQDYEPQLRQLRRGVQVVVGTPGRVIDHVNRGTLDLSGLDCLVLDEADEMLNMGFLEDVQFVLEKAPDECQVALFSATLPKPIREIADEYLSDPARIRIKSKTVTAASVRQRALFVAPRDKVDALHRILEAEETDGVIVFTKTKDSTLSVAEKLTQQGFSAVALNGDMPQKVRERTIEQLKRGQLDILVATDVAARGLDVPRISHVFNFDLPHDNESYVHRIGRTGRAGRNGEAVIFLTNAQRRQLRFIEKATKQTIEVVDLPSVDEINEARVRRFKQRITDVTAEQDLTIFKDLITQYAEESGKPIEMIAAALAEMSQNGRPFMMKERPKKKRERNDRDRGRDDFDARDRSGGRGFAGDDRPRRGKGRPLTPIKAGMTRYKLDVGWQDGVKPGNIVGAVANEAGIDGEFIGPINIRDSHTLIDLPEGMPSDIYQTLRKTWVAGKRLNLEEVGEDFQDSDDFGGRKPFHKGGHRKGKPFARDDSRGRKFSGGKRSFGNKSRNNGSTAPSAKRSKKKFKPS